MCCDCNVWQVFGVLNGCNDIAYVIDLRLMTKTFKDLPQMFSPCCFLKGRGWFPAEFNVLLVQPLLVLV